MMDSLGSVEGRELTVGKRPGRPALDGFEKLSERLVVPMTTTQYAQLREEAHAAGYRSIAEYVRHRKLEVEVRV
jgi:hypothetical protein